MSPVYCYKCRECGWRGDMLHPHQDLVLPKPCPECRGILVRDFKSEAVTNTFHPTTDLYAKSKGKK